jgi:hypothetical protein
MTFEMRAIECITRDIRVKVKQREEEFEREQVFKAGAKKGDEITIDSEKVVPANVLAHEILSLSRSLYQYERDIDIITPSEPIAYQADNDDHVQYADDVELVDIDAHIEYDSDGFPERDTHQEDFPEEEQEDDRMILESLQDQIDNTEDATDTGSTAMSTSSKPASAEIAEPPKKGTKRANDNNRKSPPRAAKMRNIFGSK